MLYALNMNRQGTDGSNPETKYKPQTPVFKPQNTEVFTYSGLASSYNVANLPSSATVNKITQVFPHLFLFLSVYIALNEVKCQMNLNLHRQWPK